MTTESQLCWFIDGLTWGLANFFCKGSNNKDFRLYPAIIVQQQPYITVQQMGVAMFKKTAETGSGI